MCPAGYKLCTICVGVLGLLCSTGCAQAALARNTAPAAMLGVKKRIFDRVGRMGGKGSIKVFSWMR